MRSLIVTCGDETFAKHAKIMLESIFSQRPGAEVAMLDLGLTESRQWFADRVKLVEPEWHYDVSDWVKQRPWMKALTARPFLNEYFPGYDVLIQVDSDTFTQDVTAYDDFVACTNGDSVAITLESHPAYPTLPSKGAYNCGVMALRGDSKTWKRWQDTFHQFLPAMNRGGYGADQSSLNFLLRSGEVSFKVLSPLHNWVCHKALPAWDGKQWVEPTSPHRAIKIIHCTLNTKDLQPLLSGGSSPAYRTVPCGPVWHLHRI